MMNLLAGVFTGFGMLFSSLFGGHQGPPQGVNATSTPREDHMMASTTFDGRMGTSTEDRMGGRQAPGVLGKVVSISGSSLIVSGRLNMPVIAGQSTAVATTSYSVDASTAKLLEFKKGVASSTPIMLSDIKEGDYVLVIGTISGDSISATTIVDGLPSHPMIRMKAGMNMNMRGGRMGSTTRSTPPVGN